MSDSYAILPCNGLDKLAGGITKEIALQLADETGSEIICPVFYRVADAKYTKLANDKPLVVLDGCSTRCASKLAAEKNLKISNKLNITDEAKSAGHELGQSHRLSDSDIEFAKRIATQLAQKPTSTEKSAEAPSDFFPKSLNYEIYKKDKFVFRVPTDAGFYFNENDVWVYVSGDKARIGVTDYMQKSLSDIMFFSAPAVGSEVEQFDEVGSLESSKAVFEVVSPVSGTVTAVNENLFDAPELINQNPYEQGWIAELTVTNFEEDRDLLVDQQGYMPILKRKADEYHA